MITGSSLYLHEVQITGKQAEKQTNIEKTKINVSQNISSVSGNLTEILKSQPGISMDAENNLYIRGNGNILILMDGRPADNPAYSNDLEHKEYIYSAYLMYCDSILEKLYCKVGARMEYNTSELNQRVSTDKISTNHLFPLPYLLIQYAVNSAQTMALSLSRRVTRPAYPQLNSFIIVIDQFTFETGNKSIRPETADKIELNHSWIKDKFWLKGNLFCSTTRDFFMQVSLLSSDNNLMLTYVNGNNLNKTGLDVDAVPAPPSCHDYGLHF